MIVTTKSTDSFARKYAGGKGYNLYLTSKQGLPVPMWTVLSAKVYECFKKENGLSKVIDEEIRVALNAPLPEQDLLKLSERLRELILDAPLSAHLQSVVSAAYEKFSGRTIAVRSSATDEDSSSHSFAGQLSSYLFIRSFDEAIYAMKQCWASGFSERSLHYRIHNGLLLSSEISVAVVLQEMVFSEKSGVLFTCDPAQRDAAKMIVNSVYGVGEGLVSGHLDGDFFVLDKKTGKVDRQTIAVKDEKFVSAPGESGCHLEKVEAHLQEQASLTSDELRRLFEMGQKVESFYGYPQDIEWAYAEGRLFLLQARPVTTQFRNLDGRLQIWDNSNIVESYGGITLPLSFSFARHNYRWVYVQFLDVLMVPAGEIHKMDYFLRNMLGLHDGRVYYNILNWYKLTSILPGFKYNRGFMETMMGTDHALADEIADRIKPPRSQETLKSKVIRAVAGLKFIYFHFTIQKMVDHFLSYFHRVYDEYLDLDFSRMPADQIQSKYHEVERRLLLEWKAPIVNDYLCMVHFGLLGKLTQLWLSAHGPSLQNDLLCGSGNLESAEPTRELIRMTSEIAADPALKTLIENTPADECLEALSNSSHDRLYERVNRYIRLYGFRCMNEMKLEEKDLYHDPKFLFVCIKNYLKGRVTDLEDYEVRERQIRDQAEAKVQQTLKGWKKAVYLWSLKNARQAVRNRENTRFCRTRIYGVARAMFNGIGRDFAARGILQTPEDIHYLEMQEVWGALDGTLTTQNLKPLVELRQAQYRENAAAEEPPSRFLTRGPVYWQNERRSPQEDTSPDGNSDGVVLAANQLRGQGACPGRIEGVAKVILDPGDDMELNGEILVTLRTDPGWIPLYPAARGLLVERGGLLSHSAIVAREMGLPTIVGVRDLTKKIKSGMRVSIDGESGMIEILDMQALASTASDEHVEPALESPAMDTLTQSGDLA